MVNNGWQPVSQCQADVELENRPETSRCILRNGFFMIIDRSSENRSAGYSGVREAISPAGHCAPVKETHYDRSNETQ